MTETLSDVKTFSLVVKRSSPAREKSRWQSFEVPITVESMSVLDGLIWVQRQRRPVAGVSMRLPGGYVRHLR